MEEGGREGGKVGDEGRSGECRKGEGEGERRRICSGSGGYNSLVVHETWLLNQVFLYLIKITPILSNGYGGMGGFSANTREDHTGAHLQVFFVL